MSRACVIGATGLLGQAFLRRLRVRGDECVGVARSGADVNVDITLRESLLAQLQTVKPDVIINCAALTDLSRCEDFPDEAALLNGLVPGWLANYSSDAAIPLVQISTDHFYTGDGPALHAEDASVVAINRYAETKLIGENRALGYPGALVIRTNITGWRGWKGRPTFFEWAVQSLLQRSPMTLFSDYYTSTIDADSCAETVLDLLEAGVSGVINVASRDCLSKREFVHEVSRGLGIDPDWTKAGSVKALKPKRAESCGLDVTRVEQILGRGMPRANQVIDALLKMKPTAIEQDIGR